MACDLQQANVWKRISAFLFDVILLAVACVLCGWGLSYMLNYDSYYDTLMTRYQAIANENGLDVSVISQNYSDLTEEEQQLAEQVNQQLAADEDALHAYEMVIQLSLFIVSFGLLIAYLLLEFLIPLLLKNGQTLGKKIFGVALMRSDSVQISPVMLFVRTVLGKYAVETMIPVMAVMMVFFGNLNLVVCGIVIVLLLSQTILFLATRKHSLIHDLLADTIAVDMGSQQIFRTAEDRAAYITKCQAESTANQLH